MKKLVMAAVLGLLTVSVAVAEPPVATVVNTPGYPPERVVAKHRDSDLACAKALEIPGVFPVVDHLKVKQH